jgi:hypothetical protein
VTNNRAFGELPARLLPAEAIARIGEARVNGTLGVTEYRKCISQLVAHVDAVELRIAPSTTTTAPRVLPEPATPLRVRPELPAPGTKEWAEHSRRVQAALAQSSGAPAPSSPSSSSPTAAPSKPAGPGESA